MINLRQKMNKLMLPPSSLPPVGRYYLTTISIHYFLPQINITVLFLANHEVSVVIANLDVILGACCSWGSQCTVHGQYSACIPTYSTYANTSIFSKQLMKHMLLILLNVYMSIKCAFGDMLSGETSLPRACRRQRLYPRIHHPKHASKTSAPIPCWE